MLKTYLHQPAKLEKAVREKNGNPKTDKRGDTQYCPPVSVLCRRITQTREVIAADSQVFKTNWVYYLAVPIQPDDKLDGKIVREVTEWVNLSGVTLGYKAVV